MVPSYLMAFELESWLRDGGDFGLNQTEPTRITLKGNCVSSFKYKLSDSSLTFHYALPDVFTIYCNLWWST